MAPRVLIGMETSGATREAMRSVGLDAISCDLLSAEDGSPHHVQDDVWNLLRYGWHLVILHPTCTYMTCSAEWAYKDLDYVRYPGVGYHQKVKPGTLVGEPRRIARQEAIMEVIALAEALDKYAESWVIENPVGVLSSAWRKPDQIIQPNWFGDDASKATCLWRSKNLPDLVPTKHVRPRMIRGKPRWTNQTDSGQNRLSPSEDRWRSRSKTYPGIAAAFAQQYGLPMMEHDL